MKSTVLRMTGTQSDAVITPPKAGLDFAAVKLGNRYMIVSADPITGVSENIGHYAINVSANDVATSGSRPQFAESVVLLPDGSSAKDVGDVARQMHRAARNLGITIVGGHTEVTPGLGFPIVVATVFSFVERYVSSRDARTGDAIMMTKSAGIEGTAALARHSSLTGKVPARVILRALGFHKKISVVEDSVAAFQTGFVRAMHDCTEGGVLGAVFEMSLASDLGFTLREDEVPVARETRTICETLSLDPLRLIGSGSVLLSVERGREAQVAKALDSVCRVTIIGEFTRGSRVLVKKDGEEEVIRSAPEDELWHALGQRT
ncbi:MAG: AIR synthase-related protein [Nitrososphaerales archaeon]